MKNYLFVCLLGFGLNVNAQLEPEQLDSIKKVWTVEIKKEMVEKGVGSGEMEGWSDFADSIIKAYAKDTFLLNGIYDRYLDLDQTDLGMVQATMEWEQGYDQLLNKYYKLLLKKLTSEEDRKLLKQSQRNWIAFRDSERALSAMLTEDRYSGGGTIQNLIYSSWAADLTKRRVEELVDYLKRLVE